MHYGYRIVEDLCRTACSSWMTEKGFATIDDFRGRSLSESSRLEPTQSELPDRRLVSTRTCVLDASSATPPAGTARTSAFTWTAPQLRPTRSPEPIPRHMVRRHDRPKSSRRISTTPIPKLDSSNGFGHSAVHVTPLERIPRVDEHHCVGCNLCALVCPVEECISMVRVENGLTPQTWEERSVSTSPAARGY